MHWEGRKRKWLKWMRVRKQGRVRVCFRLGGRERCLWNVNEEKESAMSRSGRRVSQKTSRLWSRNRIGVLEGQLGQCSRSVVSKMKQGLNDMFRKVARKHIFRPYYLQSGVRSMRNPLEGFKWKNDMLWPSLKNISLADGGGWTEEKQNCNQGDQLKGYCKWEVTVGDGEKWIYLWYVFEIQLMGSRFCVPSGPWEWWSIGPATLILSRARS